MTTRAWLPPDEGGREWKVGWQMGWQANGNGRDVGRKPLGRWRGAAGKGRDASPHRPAGERAPAALHTATGRAGAWDMEGSGGAGVAEAGVGVGAP